MCDKKIAALFVETDGVYFGLSNVIPYDVNNDAMLYNGDYPVIAHPPCNVWCRLSFACYARWGGEHNRPGNDGGKFLHALKTVRRCGGVLEHPAFSNAWKKYDLVRPVKGAWTKSDIGWVCEVCQSAYGHKARKKTWLYFVGKNKPNDLCWDCPDGVCVIGHSTKMMAAGKHKKELSRKEASRTPFLFRDALIDLIVSDLKGD